MSRVGKMPIAVPKGVDVAIAGDQITVKSAGGTLTLEGTVKTYRYMDNDEIAEFEAANAPKTGKGAKKPAPAKTKGGE